MGQGDIEDEKFGSVGRKERRTHNFIFTIYKAMY
jgi:hypothetical protein